MIKTLAQAYAAGATVKYNIPATNFRLLALSASQPVTVRFYQNGAVKSEAVDMLDGFADEGQPFDAVEIYSAAAQTVTIVIADGRVKYDRFSGSVSVTNLPATQPVSGAVSVSNLPATQPVSGSVANTAPEQPQVYGASYKSNTALAANTPETVFTAAQNINGAILHRASFVTEGAGLILAALLAKATPPTTISDGDVIVSPSMGNQSGAAPLMAGILERPIKIPAGKGLFYIANITESMTFRSVLYTLL